jgi:hypothetical protein
MADKPTTTPTKPTQPQEKIEWPKAFKDWAAGRTGPTEKELIDIFATSYNLTPAERKTLEGQIKPETPKPPAPKPTAPVPAPPQKQPTVKPTLIIARTPYPKWWKDLQTAAIDMDNAGTEIIVLPGVDFYLYVATIVLTVDGETDITFGFGVFGQSGSMDLGGNGEPKGMVIATGNSPTSCGQGSFKITSTGVAVHVGGFVSYYRESVKED